MERFPAFQYYQVVNCQLLILLSTYFSPLKPYRQFKYKKWVKYCISETYYCIHFVFVKHNIYILLHACSVTLANLFFIGRFPVPFLSYLVGSRRPNLITGLIGWLSRTGGRGHLGYGRSNQIPNLVGKTDHNVGGLVYILGLTNPHNLSP